MLMMSRVCADFRDAKGAVIFRVTPETRLTFVEAPEAIRQDPLFRLLLSDGSVEASLTPERRRQLEQEPEGEPDGKAEGVQRVVGTEGVQGAIGKPPDSSVKAKSTKKSTGSKTDSEGAQGATGKPPASSEGDQRATGKPSGA